MTESFLDKVLRWCRAQKLNIDPSVETSFDGSEAFLCRLRPWKQRKGAEVMYLSAGDTFETAVRQAVMAYNAGRSTPLDWAARPWDGDSDLGSITGNPDDLPF